MIHMENSTTTVLPIDINKAHGSPYDCGSSDSGFWKRPKFPHYRNPKNWKLIPKKDMTAEQIAEYEAGYESNHQHKGNK